MKMIVWVEERCSYQVALDVPDDQDFSEGEEGNQYYPDRVLNKEDEKTKWVYRLWERDPKGWQFRVANHDHKDSLITDGYLDENFITEIDVRVIE